MTVLAITVREEGGYYCPDKDPSAPIRIYSDRRIQDDIVTGITGQKWRKRLTRKEYRRVRKAALSNRAEGIV